MNLTVVIPVYDEQHSIPELISRIKTVCQKYAPFEIICVDDGSTDGSLDKLINEKERCPQLKIIKFKRNYGKSAALDAAFIQSQGGIVVTIDADLQNPPEEIPKLINAMMETDVAIGWRSKREDTIAKRFASRFANSFRNWFLNDDAHDTGCGLKAFRKHTLKDLRVHKGMHRFFPALMKRKGFSIVEVKIEDARRPFGVSKYGTFSRAFPSFWNLIALIFNLKQKCHYEIEKIV